MRNVYEIERHYITRTMRSYERPVDFWERTKWWAIVVILIGLALCGGM